MIRLCRTYPSAMRVASSNLDPLPMWRSGVQMAALNMQTVDLPVSLHYALFERGGGSGYVLKPPEMRQLSPNHPHPPAAEDSPPSTAPSSEPAQSQPAQSQQTAQSQQPAQSQPAQSQQPAHSQPVKQPADATKRVQWAASAAAPTAAAFAPIAGAATITAPIAAALPVPVMPSAVRLLQPGAAAAPRAIAVSGVKLLPQQAASTAPSTRASPSQLTTPRPLTTDLQLPHAPAADADLEAMEAAQAAVEAAEASATEAAAAAGAGDVECSRATLGAAGRATLMLSAARFGSFAGAGPAVERPDLQAARRRRRSPSPRSPSPGPMAGVQGTEVSDGQQSAAVPGGAAESAVWPPLRQTCRRVRLALQPGPAAWPCSLALQPGPE